MKLSELSIIHVLHQVPPSDHFPRESYYIRASVNEKDKVQGLKTSHILYRLNKLLKKGLVEKVEPEFLTKRMRWKRTVAGDQSLLKFGNAMKERACKEFCVNAA